MATLTGNTPWSFLTGDVEAGSLLVLTEGVSSLQTFSVGAQRLVSQKPVSMGLVNRYVEAAMRHAQVKQLEDQTWYVSIPGLPGVWADEPNAWQAITVLKEVVLDWLIVKIAGGDRDLPVLEGIDLNAL